ncbi:MAG: hypothetical protein ACRDNM_10665, partial [Gaiellaceae bacterium]
DIGMTGLVHDVALWHGVLAFGFGLVLGLSFDTVPALAPAAAPAAVAAGPARTMTARSAASEPVTAERREVGTPSGRPNEVVVGPKSGHTPTRMD